MSNPTPGPYTISPLGYGYEVRGIYGVSVGTFGRAWVGGLRGSHAVETPECEANARALVDGIAAIAKLERIRDICWNQNEPASRLAEIVELLRSKP